MADVKMILLSTGDEDQYLTGNPDYTFFKQGNKQYTYFGQNWNLSSPNFSEMKGFFKPNCKYSYRLPIQGDIISDMVLRIGVNTLPGCVCSSGFGKACPYKVFKKIEIRYNDIVLSSLDTNYIKIFNELSSDIMVKKPDLWAESGGYIHIPLPFWFTRNPGSAFPIWLLNNPQITIHIETGDYNHSNDIQIDILSLYTNLTLNEKETFKHSSLEYLIEQIDICNKISIEKSSKCVSVDLPQTKFIKYLAWNIVKDCPEGSGCDYEMNEEGGGNSIINNSNILLNGNSISGDMSSRQTLLINRHCYFKAPWNNSSLSKIHTYSFSLDPNIFQSAGFLTSDKFSNFKLKLDLENNSYPHYSIHTYAIKNNIMRIKDGKLELLYN